MYQLARIITPGYGYGWLVWVRVGQPTRELVRPRILERISQDAHDHGRRAAHARWHKAPRAPRPSRHHFGQPRIEPRLLETALYMGRRTSRAHLITQLISLTDIELLSPEVMPPMAEPPRMHVHDWEAFWSTEPASSPLPTR